MNLPDVIFWWIGAVLSASLAIWLTGCILVCVILIVCHYFKKAIDKLASGVRAYQDWKVLRDEMIERGCFKTVRPGQ